ncbi:MAG: hypothetical protein RL033_2857, partial [Pseudomonadota bacterium]
GQRWNSYSYVLNNPLRYTDPTGFGDDDEAAPDLPLVSLGPAFDANHAVDPTHMVEWHCTADGYSECRGVTVAVPAAGDNLGTAQTGSSSEDASAPAASGGLDPQAVSGTLQAWGGFGVGLGLGLIPGGAVADQASTCNKASHTS